MSAGAAGVVPAGKIMVQLFEGNRLPMRAGVDVLVRVRDGRHQEESVTTNTPTVAFPNLRFFDNNDDLYTVIASASGYRQAGIHPIHITPKAWRDAHLMLVQSDAGFSFAPVQWDALGAAKPDWRNVLAAGAATPDEALNRYRDLLENSSGSLACFLNLAAAMESISFSTADDTPMRYIKQLIWTKDTLKPDRFYAYADPLLIEKTREAAGRGLFQEEPAPGTFHAGATKSWKEVRLDEANVQLTFHEGDRKEIGGVNCVKVEPDMDYFKDLGAHALLEVFPNLFGGKTDPRQIYTMRWMAHKHFGLPEFNPLYTLEA